MLKTCSNQKVVKTEKYQWCLRIQEMENSCRITIGKFFWKNHFFELRSRLQQQDTKARASKCWFLRKKGGHTWWQWFRIVPGAVLSIESKNGVRISKNKKCNIFAFSQNPENIQRGDPWKKKNSKCSNLDETCRTGGDHHKNKLGSDFEVFLHLVGVWGIKKWRILEEKKHQKWRFFKFS